MLVRRLADHGNRGSAYAADPDRGWPQAVRT